MPASLYPLAREIYAAHGIDTEAALQTLATIPISLHCWQGDDVIGFEPSGGELTGGIQATGNYPGAARTIDELRADLDVAYSLIPGKHRLNLHAIYGDFGERRVERDAISIEHFQSWVDWCRERQLGLDFNPTCFSHPKLVDGLTVSHPDPGISDFWIEHCRRCREIAGEMGRQLGTPCVTNFWFPDGSKDTPVDRKSPRLRLEAALDRIFEKDIEGNIDSVESKLFGIGSESYVVGSHEFYMGYAVSRQKHLCLDAGHFHPTESVADKISSVLEFVPGLLLHVSRGVRWDSDHVVLKDDPTQDIMHELVRGDFLGRVHIGLDFFDASINRIAAWVIGTRNAQKCLLHALLHPIEALRRAEAEGDFTGRLALLEECKTLPWGSVWEEFCTRQNAPTDHTWLAGIKQLERDTLLARSNAAG